MPTIGTRLDADALKRLRMAQRLTMAEVARSLDLTPTFYSRVEAGEARVSLRTLGKIEAFYGLDPELLELIHRQDRPRFVSPG